MDGARSVEERLDFTWRVGSSPTSSIKTRVGVPRMDSQHLIVAIEAMFQVLSSEDRLKVIKQLTTDFCRKCGRPEKQHGDYCDE